MQNMGIFSEHIGYYRIIKYIFFFIYTFSGHSDISDNLLPDYMIKHSDFNDVLNI
jgi:hypothetical protein